MWTLLLPDTSCPAMSSYFFPTMLSQLGSTHLPPQRRLNFPKSSRPPSPDQCACLPQESNPREAAALPGDKV